jgi:hypothetical protein
MEPRSGTTPQDDSSQCQLDDGQQTQHATAQGKRFNRLFLQHSAQKLACSLMAHFLWSEPQGTCQQSRFQEAAEPNG